MPKSQYRNMSNIKSNSSPKIFNNSTIKDSKNSDEISNNMLKNIMIKWLGKLKRACIKNWMILKIIQIKRWMNSSKNLNEIIMIVQDMIEEFIKIIEILKKIKLKFWK
jgi:hypothetical protein